jgi:hypothetical protein
MTRNMEMFRKKRRAFLDGQERKFDYECYVELDSKRELEVKNDMRKART